MKKHLKNKKSLNIAMLGHKRIPSREGGIEIVVEELATRMVTLGHKVTCYNRSGHHVSGKDFDGGKRKAYKGVRLKSVLTLDSGVTFFMTYVLPMAMDDLDTWKGLVVFGILMAMLFSLMWKTNLYYQNPVLTVLGYEVFSFEFETTQLTEYNGKECIGITRGTINVGHSIKRQKISDNVFLVYEDR